jgi:hypothetical protein
MIKMSDQLMQPTWTFCGMRPDESMIILSARSEFPRVGDLCSSRPELTEWGNSEVGFMRAAPYVIASSGRTAQGVFSLFLCEADHDARWLEVKIKVGFTGEWHAIAPR